MKTISSLPKLLTIQQAADVLHVHPETLRRWDRQGRLKAVRVGTRQNLGDRKYRLDDIERLRNDKEGNNPLKSGEPKLTALPEPTQLTERQKKIWQYLADTNPKAADTYAGAVRVRGDLLNPDRIAQAAHSLRELNLLLVPKDKQEKSDKTNGDHVERIKSYMKSQDLLGGLPENVAEKVAGQWVDTYGWFVAVAHHGRVPNEEKFDQQLQILENIIESQIGPFYNSVEKIDQLITLKRPSLSDLVSLRTLIKKQAHYEYFFRTLNSAPWLPVLVKEGYFKNPPSLIKDDEGNIRYPAWVESEFLIKIADIKPEEVCGLILSSQTTDNPWVHCDFIEAAIKMPSKIAVKIIPKIKRETWFDTLFMSRSADKGGELLEKLAKDVMLDDACSLASLLLDVKKVEQNSTFNEDKDKKTYEAKSCIDDWQYEQILEKKLPALVAADPIRTITLLRNILEKAIRHVTGKANYEEPFILNYKRPAIEDNEQNWAKEDVENQLITTIRNAINSIDTKKPTVLKNATACLGHPDGIYRIMLRLQIYTYSNNPQIFRNEIMDVLKNKSYFFDEQLTHEYKKLLSTNYQILPEDAKDLILSWIDKGPGGKFTGKHLEYWQTQKLDVIKDFLQGPWKKKYDDLTAKYKPESSEFGTTVGTWVGPTSPESEDKLAAKNPDEIIKLITEWTPIKDPTAPSPEGLGRVFETVVTKDATSYVKKFKQVFGSKVRAVYLYHLITGIKNSLKQAPVVDWDDILPTLKKITATESPYEYPHDEGFYETGWGGVRKSIVDLFEEVFKKDSNEIPFKYRDQVWEILSQLVEDPDPDIEHEKKYGGRNMNPVTLSINTVRGDAFHALIQYALWVSRNTYSDEKTTILTPEVKKVLEKHLDPTVDPTETIRSVYGHYYPTLYYLDKQWATDHLDKIFRPFGDRLSLAAWRTYIGYASLWIPVVKFLRPLYQEAVEHLDPKVKGDETDNRLDEHLMIGYWRGDLDLTDSLLKQFYKNAPDTVRAHAVWFLWRSIEEAKLQKTSPEWKRLKLMWHQRLNDITEKRTDEISRFADWLSSAPEDINGLYDLIKATIPHLTRGSDVGYLVGYLKANLGANIELVADLLFETVKENTEDIKYRIHDQDIIQILTAAIQSDSVKARDSANKIINMFGERGNHAFKGILSKSE